MTELTNVGVLVRRDPITRVLTTASCKVCGCTWGIRDQLIPSINPYTIADHVNNWPKTISCGQCGRLLE